MKCPLSFVIIMAFVLLTSCKKANSNQDVCNMGYYFDHSDEVVIEEPELIPVPIDTAVLEGSWKLIKYHSPYFNIEPTAEFDYVIKFSGKTVEMKFAANELLSEYRLLGDSLRLGNTLMTSARGADLPLEKALYDLLTNNNLIAQCAQCSGLQLNLMAKDEINGKTYADFQKIK